MGRGILSLLLSVERETRRRHISGQVCGTCNRRLISYISYIARSHCAQIGHRLKYTRRRGARAVAHRDAQSAWDVDRRREWLLFCWWQKLEATLQKNYTGDGGSRGEDEKIVKGAGGKSDREPGTNEIIAGKERA